MSAAMQGPRRAGVVDLGTQSAVLAAGELAETGAVEVLLEAARLPALGRSLAATGQLEPDDVARAAAALEELAALSLGAGCPLREVIGTAVFRRATNGAAAARTLAEAAGAPVRIVTGEEEARLAHAGASAGRPDALVVDVGGGSTELVTDGGRWACSAEVGASWLAERGRLDGWSLEERRAEASRRIEQALAAAGTPPAFGEVLLVGGTAVNAGSLAQDPGAVFSIEAAAGAVTDPEALRAWASRLDLLPLDERRLFALEAERVGTLPEGLLCLAAALEAVGATSARISVRGLRHAALARVLAAGA